jgi:hypothetical protein
MNYIKRLRKRVAEENSVGNSQPPKIEEGTDIAGNGSQEQAIKTEPKIMFDCTELIERMRINADPVELVPVGTVPSTLYCANYIDQGTQDALLECIHSEGSKTSPSNVWKYLSRRRLQCWGKSAPGQDTDISGSQFPKWLQGLADDLVLKGVFDEVSKPNQVLINDYNENEGIMHHCDGAAYHDRVAVLSLASTRVLTFRPKLRSEEIGITFGGDIASVILEPGSLFVFSEVMFTDMLHGIESLESVDAFNGCCQVVSGGAVECLNYQLTSFGRSGENCVHWKPRSSLTFRRVKV